MADKKSNKTDNGPAENKNQPAVNKPQPARQSFMRWAKVKGVENMAVGACVRFEIDTNEPVTLREFEGYVKKYSDAVPGK